MDLIMILENGNLKLMLVFITEEQQRNLKPLVSI